MEGHRDSQGAGAHDVQGEVEGAGSVQPGEGGCGKTVRLHTTT